MDDERFMRLKEIQNTFQKELDLVYRKEDIDSFFFMLLDSLYNVSRLQLAMEPNFKIENGDAIFNALKALKQEQPIQYIIGKTEFYGLPFVVNKDVLIPRPETEELVDWVVNSVTSIEVEKPLNILDIGTGSGCIAISLAKSIPNAKIYAVDISEKAIQVAKRNAKLNDVEVDFFEADILSMKPNHPSLMFDIIVSNPPYVRVKEKKQMRNNVLNNEPHLALFVKDENPLLFYNAISDLAINKLNKKGLLFFEINEYLGNDTIQLLKEKQFKNIELKQDIFKKDRMIKAIKGNSL